MGAPGKLSREDAVLGRRRAGQLSLVADRSCVAERGVHAVAGWTEYRRSFAYEFTWPAAEFWAGVVQPGSVRVDNAMRVLLLVPIEKCSPQSTQRSQRVII